MSKWMMKLEFEFNSNEILPVNCKAIRNFTTQTQARAPEV